MARTKQEKSATQERKCIVPQCPATKIMARGLCSECYPAALHQVLINKTTWEQLESLGLANPKHSKRSVFYSAFTAATAK
jgi:hypothetical protein